MMIGTIEARSRCAEELDNLLADGPYSLDEEGLQLLNFLGYGDDEIDLAIQKLVAAGGVRADEQDGIILLSRTPRWWANLGAKVASLELPEAVRKAIVRGGDPWELGLDPIAVSEAVVRALRGAGFSRGEVEAIFTNYPIGQSLGYLRTYAQSRTLEELIDRAAATPIPVGASPLVVSMPEPMVEPEPRPVVQRPAGTKRKSPFPRGKNFEVRRVVRTQGLRGSYRLTIRTDDEIEGTVTLSPSKLLSRKDFRIACINVLNFLPEMPEDLTNWNEFAHQVIACAETEEIEWMSDVDSVVVKATADFVRARGKWRGTATDLLNALDARVSDKPDEWPTNSMSLRYVLNRSLDALAAAGVDITFFREAGGNRTRMVQLLPKKPQGM